MSFATKAQFDTIRQITYSDLFYSYQSFGTPLSVAARVMRIVNSTNADVYLSTDGHTNQVRLASGSFLLLDFTTNRFQESGLFLSIGTQFFVTVVSSSSLPSMGAVWIEIIYATNT